MLILKIKIAKKVFFRFSNLKKLYSKLLLEFLHATAPLRRFRIFSNFVFRATAFNVLLGWPILSSK